MKRFLFATAVVLVAGAASGDTLIKPQVMSVLKYSIDSSKNVVVLDNGYSEGIVPGDKGVFRNRVNNTTIDFEVARVLSDGHHFVTVTTASEYLLQHDLTAEIVPTKKCSVKGEKPELKGDDVITGKAPPAGYVFANVTYVGENPGPLPGDSACGDASFRFDIDKGYEEVLPGANAYSIVAGSGIPMPFKVTIKWANKDRAGGCVLAPNTSAAKANFKAQRVVVEKAHCHSIK